MKKTNIIIVFLSVFCLNCQIHCPEFPNNLNYFPYYEGQELNFINSQQTIHTFVISNKYNSTPDFFSHNCKCECNIETKFNIYSNQDSLSMDGGIYITGRKDASYVSVSCFGLRKYILERKSVPYDKLSKYLEDTIVIEDENNKVITKIVIVNGKGLVSYTTADGEEWKLVE